MLEFCCQVKLVFVDRLIRFGTAVYPASCDTLLATLEPVGVMHFWLV